jgi:hypothetical protein
MNMMLAGQMQVILPGATSITIETITPQETAYFSQYLWMFAPLFIVVAFVSNNIYFLFGIPLFIAVSLFTVVFKQQDQSQLIKVIHRALAVI